MFKLALLLGKTVGELEVQLTSKELSEWMAYDRLQPLPEPWVQTGLTCATLANLWSNKRHEAKDFMPVVRRRQSPQEQRQKLKAFFSRYKAT